MKKILITAFICISILKTHGQNRIAYYDAVYLKSVMDANGGKFKIAGNGALFKAYFGPITDAALTLKLQNNPFLSQYFSSAGVAGAPGNTAFPKGIISSIGNLNVTNFADGLAKFLVERSKEELNVAFFRKFQEYLSHNPEVKVIFPATVGIINNIMAYNYTAMLPALRAAFQKDLNAFSTNLLNLRDPKKYGSDYAANSVRIDNLCKFLNTTLAGRSAVAALLITDGIMKNNNAADILSNLSGDKICEPNDYFSNWVQFVDLVSKSLRSTDEGRIWITKQEATELITDDATLQIYLGLLYATDQKNAHHIQLTFDTTPVTLQSFLSQLKTKWPTKDAEVFKEKFKDLANSVTRIADNAKAVIDSKKQGADLSIAPYADYATSIADFLKSATFVLSDNAAIDPRLTGKIPDLKELADIIDNAVDCSYDIKSQNYGSLVLHTSAIINLLMPDNSAYPFKASYVKYGTFMANIIEAKSSDEVKAAIDAAVLPVGSSSVKRETAANISLNAYIGPYLGGEYMPVLPDKRTSVSAGITAPVGLAFSWGQKHFWDGKNPGGKSFTIFLSLIDVGALASFRLNDDKSNIASDIQLKNIISPGCYFYWGLGKCPVSIGAGAQVGPQLRQVSTTVNTNSTNNIYIRYSLTIAVDIPLLNFYTKSDH
ncbi:MAG: hypothetical protein V4592_10450 [Bacteroidota bacterium]